MKKTVIITGGTKGIGLSIAKAFHDEGMNVVVGARLQSQEIKKFDSRIRFVQMDVRKEMNHRELIKVARQWTGRVDVYVNCAGFFEWKPVHEIDKPFWDLIIDTNLKGTFWGCKVAAENLKEGGVIINISSLAGKRGSANNSAYCASKFGVNGLTQSLARELGSKGIRVNAICPVYVKTPFLHEQLKHRVSPAQGKDVDQYLKQFSESQSALKRLPTMEEVATTCLFLASDKASAITGQSLIVDCGVFPT